ncbi:MAG: LamG domain-containing protein, partial [Candidatus Woesearchaeota archaeon]
MKKLSRKKRVDIVHVSYFLSFILLSFMTYLIVLNIGFVGAAVFNVGSQGEFDQGTYNNTEWSVDHVQLSSGNTEGTYTSEVFDVNNTAIWNNISWIKGAPYQEELPNAGAVEIDIGGANMSGNVLLMHMNEVSGDIIDYSGYGNDGLNRGGISYGVDGKFNDGLSFDGSNDWIQISDDSSLDITGDITIEAWIYPRDFSNQPDLITKGSYNQAYSIWVDSDGTVVFVINGDSFSSVSGLNVDNWYHITVVKDGSNGYIYLDGAEDNSGNNVFDSAIQQGSYNLFVSTLDYPFDMIADEVSIFNRALSSTEVFDHYKRGSLRLNLTVRSCDDDACNGESWIDINDNSSQSLSLDDNQYFQYNYDFNTENLLYSPELYNVSIDYTMHALPDNSPTTTLLNPENGSITDIKNVDFECNASDDIQLSNISFYWDYAGS